MTLIRRRIVKTTITYLRMLQPPAAQKIRAPQGAKFVPAIRPPVHFYRYIYDKVGRSYKWVSRAALSDDNLAAIIHDDDVAVNLVCQNGVPAGFSEISWLSPPICEITFLGLVPDYIGKGLGQFLLRHTIAAAWRRPIEKLLIQTCTLDHPAALPLYQKGGFTPYTRREETVIIPKCWPPAYP